MSISEHAKALKDKFPEGKRVYLTGEAARMFPKLVGVRGQVVGISRDGNVKVRFAGRTVVNAWFPDYLRGEKP